MLVLIPIKNIMCHFTFCKCMHDFLIRFCKIWDDCLSDTTISNMKPVVGYRRLDNFQDYLVRKNPTYHYLRAITNPKCRKL